MENVPFAGTFVTDFKSLSNTYIVVSTHTSPSQLTQSTGTTTYWVKQVCFQPNSLHTDLQTYSTRVTAWHHQILDEHVMSSTHGQLSSVVFRSSKPGSSWYLHIVLWELPSASSLASYPGSSPCRKTGRAWKISSRAPWRTMRGFMCGFDNQIIAHTLWLEILPSIIKMLLDHRCCWSCGCW